MQRGLLLFDLDGTILDTAPDLCEAANFLRRQKGLEPLAYEALRPYAGTGARGLVGAALQIAPEDPEYPNLRQEFLTYYACHMADKSRPFPGILDALRSATQMGFSWGIVTNKAMRLAKPLVEKFFAAAPAYSCLIAGDSAPKMKPNPDTLLMALKVAGFSANKALYFGDEERDMVAANAAGVGSVAVLWGYGKTVTDTPTKATIAKIEEIPGLAAKLLD